MAMHNKRGGRNSRLVARCRVKDKVPFGSTLDHRFHPLLRENRDLSLIWFAKVLIHRGCTVS